MKIKTKTSFENLRESHIGGTKKKKLFKKKVPWQYLVSRSEFSSLQLCFCFHILIIVTKPEHYGEDWQSLWAYITFQLPYQRVGFQGECADRLYLFQRHGVNGMASATGTSSFFLRKYRLNFEPKTQITSLKALEKQSHIGLLVYLSLQYDL